MRARRYEYITFRGYHMFRSLGVALATFCFFGFFSPLHAKENHWEKEIQEFEKQDAKTPPPKGQIVFVGSSSVRLWDTGKSFPKHKIINRGFGGSQAEDVLHFFKRIVLKYKPRLVVLYVGDNDVAAGKSKEKILADTEEILFRLHKALPKTRLVYIAIKPSLARWEMIGKMRAVNERIKALSELTPYMEFIDVDAPMLGKDGKPLKSLFAKDGLHLSEKGYALWSGLVRPYLRKDVK